MVERVQPNKIIEGGGSYFSRPNNVKKFSSGSKLLDLALGGGWALGRTVNIIADTSVGKTLLAIEACATFARLYPNGIIKYRESEAAFDTSYAAALGMPVDRVDQGPDVPFNTVEEMYDDIALTIEESRGEPGLYIVDSLDALSSNAELKREIDEASYAGEKAKKLSEIFRKVTQPLEDKNITFMVISQIRDKMNAMPFQQKWTISGGRALSFYSSQRLFLAQTGQVKIERHGIKQTIGTEVQARVIKNKVGLPFREAHFKIIFGFGVDDTDECMDFLKKSKGLSYLDIPESGVSKFLRDMDKLPDEDYRREIARIHAAVEKRWWEVEKAFLPDRTKY